MEKKLRFARCGLLTCCLVLIGGQFINGQSSSPDSFRRIVAAAKTDTGRINAINELAYALLYSKPDSCYFYANEALSLSQKINYQEGIIISQENIAFTYVILGNYSKSLSLLLEALRASEAADFTKGRMLANVGLGAIYAFQKDHRRAIEYNLRGIADAQLIHDEYWIRTGLSNISLEYSDLNIWDSARYYNDLVYQKQLLANDRMGISVSLHTLGLIHVKQNNYDSALHYVRRSVSVLKEGVDDYLIPAGYLTMAEIFEKQHHDDSTLYYANRSLGVAQKINFLAAKVSGTSFLANYYKSRKNVDSTLKYLELSALLKDSAFGQEKTRDFQNLTIEENLRQQQVEQARRQARQEYATKLKFYGLIAAFGVLLLVAWFLYRNGKQQKRSKLKIEQAYHELRSTQAQLIQSEKMASLGELTAGIAHEIQNPLNFVNNFSELNNELIREMKAELATGNLQLVNEIAGDISSNSQKIHHHGQRADGIVKSMLQHSRQSNGQKEPTDINALCDEYARLAYHGLRAKDKSFNARIEMDFDPAAGKINIIPQDIGRVILTLVNNAFLAVSEKKKKEQDGYEPTVTVTTHQANGMTEINVRDNGSGVPENIKEKIFQPFFTTRPAGQGTGLGLSLAFEIVAKGHGGELKLETGEGKETKFIVLLPSNGTR